MTEEIETLLISELPYALHLKEDIYEGIYKNKKFVIILQKKCKYPSKNPGESDKCVFESGIDGTISTAQGVEQPEDDLGEFSNSLFQIITQISKEEYNKIIDNNKKTIEVRYLIIPRINKLIRAYNYHSEEVYSRPLIEEDIRWVNIRFGKEGGCYSRYFRGGKMIMAKSAIKNDETHKKIVESLADEEFDIPFFEEILMNAKYFQYKGDFRMSVVESIIALESVLPSFLKKKWLTKGLKKEDIIRKMHNIDLNLMLTNELQLVIPEDKKIDETLICDVKSINSIRNKIIHQGFKEVSKNDSQKAIDCIRKLIGEINKL